MNCPLCGEVCRCYSEPPFPASPQWEPGAGRVSASASSSRHRAEIGEERLIDPDAPDSSEQRFAARLEAGAEPAQPTSGMAAEEISSLAGVADVNSAAEPAAAPVSTEEAVSSDENSSEWRDELSARLNRYRARRKIRPPHYPSLNLPFDTVESSARGDSYADGTVPGFKPVSDQALALDGMRPAPLAAGNTDAQLRHAPAEEVAPQRASHPAGFSGAKIIEFPRFAWGPPPPPPDQLAEPVSDRPRILEVPEVAPPPPALGGITIEGEERQEAEKRPGIDIPLQSAALARRVLAGGIDGVIVAAASALFGVIFWKVALSNGAAVRPPLVQILGLAAGIPALLWAAYQYLLIGYGGSTPGLRVAGLELARFDGTRPGRRLRRWRVLASYLSAASIGLGYAWLFLDEDALCWHDRITHTYLAPGKARFQT